MSYRREVSPYSSSMDSMSNGSTMSPFSTNESSPNANRYIVLEVPNMEIQGDYTEDNENAPYLEIVEQPVDKFRFRYRSEMLGTHGSLMAKRSERGKKVHPSVELKNYTGRAIISCSLYQVDENNRLPHSHHLVLRNSHGPDDVVDPHHIEVDDATGYVAVFAGMGIIHTAKKYIADELFKKLRKLKQYQNLRQSEILELKSLCSQNARHMNLNSVCLCFEAFDALTLEPICKRVFSANVNNMKSALTGDLKICRLSRCYSSVIGGDEVFLFVEKVGKKNIKVKFFELDDDDMEIWSAYGSFSDFDVHHQYAIALKTPPYKDQNIQEPVQCYIQLLRPSDGDLSEPHKFSYRPSGRIINNDCKRPRIDSTFNSDEFINTLPTTLTSMKLSTGEFDSSECASLGLCESDINKINSDDFKDFIKSLNNEFTGTVFSFEQGNLQLDCLGSFNKECSVESSVEKKGMTPRKILTNENYSSHGTKKGVKEVISTTKDEVSEERKESDEIESQSKSKNIKSDSEKSHEKMLNYLRLQKNNENNQDVKKSLTESKWNNERSAGLQIFNDFEIKHQLIMLLKKIKDPKAASDTKTKRDNEAAVRKLFMTGEEGNTVLHGAVELDEMSIVRDMLHLLVHCNLCELLNTKNDFGKSILHRAIEKERYTYIKPLLAAGIDPNIVDDNGDTPLHTAVRVKSLNAVIHLLNSKSKDKKILINKFNNDGKTALHLAAALGKADIIAKLLANDADLNETEDLIGNTALHIAVDNNHLDVVQLLLNNQNVMVNAYNKQGHTPLHLACVINDGKGSAEIVEELLQAMADPLLPMNVLKKEQICDEDDSEEDEMIEHNAGDAFELAASNPQILRLLEKYTPNAPQKENIPMKLDEAEIFYDASELEMIEVKYEPTDTCSFDEETIIRLSKVLDKTGNWETVAEMLGLNSLMTFVDKQAQSPTRVLLEHIENSDHLCYQTLIDILRALEEDECVKIMESMMFKVCSK